MAYVWRLWAPGATQPDWIVGTMHVPLPSGASFPPPLAQALTQASWVATEIDPEGVSPALVRRYVAQPPGRSLSRQLGPRRWRALLATGKVDAKAAEGLRPWAVALAFLPPPRRPSMDESLRSAGAAAGARLGSLESPAEQLGALAAVPDREMIRQLDELAADPSRGAREQDTLELAYRQGDLATIRRLLLDPARMRRYPGFYRKLFAERNGRMAERLDSPLRRERAVVAVGLGHLLGTGSVLRRLEARGWRVEAVWPSPGRGPAANPAPTLRHPLRPSVRPVPRHQAGSGPIPHPSLAPRKALATPAPRATLPPGARPTAAPGLGLQGPLAPARLPATSQPGLPQPAARPSVGPSPQARPTPRPPRASGAGALRWAPFHRPSPSARPATRPSGQAHPTTAPLAPRRP